MTDTESILHTRVPHKNAPNVLFADRFEAWQDVLASLRAHFKSIATAEIAHNKQLQRIVETVPEPFSKYEMFDKGGSIQGVGKLLHEQSSGRVTHSNHIIQALDEDIIPFLEKTQEYLKERTNHIRSLGGDFENDLEQGLSTSKAAVTNLQSAINDWDANNGKVTADKDPFVVDLSTRKHLRHSLGEENYLRETTINLEQSAHELEKNVVNTVQQVLAKYNDLVSTEAAELAIMSERVEQSILAGHLNSEWTSFTKAQYAAGSLVEPSSQARSLETAFYPGKNHISTAPICDGWLEKKSKFLGNYSTAFYLISPSRFLHEFRSNDLRVDSVPTFSLYLPDCEVASLSKETDKVHRFVLTGTSAASGIHTDRDWTFRTKTREELLTWYTNIGRASDPAFQFGTHPAAPASTNPVVPRHSELEHADDAHAPFKGPETIAMSEPAPQRPPAGRFDTGGFATPWAAAAAALNAQPSSALRETETPRLATTHYGSTVEVAPVSYPEHDEHLRQASVNSSAGHFLDQEILDQNAYLEYDKVHGTHSTLVGDENFKPADADVSISRTSSVNGRLTKPRRSASLAFQEVAGSPASAVVPSQARSRGPSKVPSRKATATYGDLSNLPLPSMTEVNEAPSPAAEIYTSPYFPAPGEGTSGALPSSRFSNDKSAMNLHEVTTIRPARTSTTNSGTNTPSYPGQVRAPVRKMSLSEQILYGGSSAHVDPSGSRDSLSTSEHVHTDLEPLVASAVGMHDDARSPYPATQRFRVPRSRQGSMLAPANDSASEPLEAYDVAPHMRVGTQSNEARYKVGSRRGSRSASVIATPHESTEPSMFDRSALDSLSADTLAAKLHQPSSGEKARARRPPSRGASMDLGDGTSSPASPAFNVNTRHAFRKPPSRGSSLSLGNTTGGAAETPGLLNTINETFERDLAAALGNKEGDRHVPGDFPK